MLRAWRRVALTRRLTKCRPDFAGDDADAAVYSLVALLDDSQLETLANVVEVSGSDGHVMECIIVEDASQCHPHVVSCQLWRWPFVQSAQELRCMPWCQHKNENSKLLNNSHTACCQPYHWSRQLVYDDKDLLLCAESPPPPYVSPASSEKQLVECYSTDLSHDLSVSDIGDTCEWKNPAAWCHVSYWEFRHRVGQQFPVVSSWINVSQDLPLCGGLSLSALQKQPVSLDVPVFQYHKPSDVDKLAISRTRGKIGQGIVLSRECGNVWLYNCSDYPVFVSSPTFFPLAHNSSSFPSVRKLPPGHCLCAFDGNLILKLAVGELSCGHYSIQVSFAKGWGSEYSRQFITACPCWIEVHVTHPHYNPVT